MMALLVVPFTFNWRWVLHLASPHNHKRWSSAAHICSQRTYINHYTTIVTTYINYTTTVTAYINYKTIVTTYIN